MKLHDAITLAIEGKKMTCSCLPPGSVLKTIDDGDLRVVFEATGSSYVFTPRNEHYRDDWREVGGWASYA